MNTKELVNAEYKEMEKCIHCGHSLDILFQPEVWHSNEVLSLEDDSYICGINSCKCDNPEIGNLNISIFVFACNKHKYNLRKSFINKKLISSKPMKVCFFNHCFDDVTVFGILKSNFIISLQKRD